MSPKVIHINAHGKYSTGTIATSIIDCCSSGSQLFHTRDDIDKPYAKKFYSKFGFYLDVALTRLTGLDSVWSWGNTRKILRAIKEEDPDILHLHNLHGFYLNYRMLFRFIKKHNVKVVWTLHDCWSFTGHCPHFDFIGCDKWQTQCRQCPQYKQSYLKGWLFDNSRLGYRLKKRSFLGVKHMAIVTPSAWLAGLVKESFLKDYPVKVINNGISTDNFNICPNETFRELLPTDKKIVIAVASSWDKKKGLDDVVEISRRLSEGYQVVIVGVSASQKAALANENMIAITKTDNQKQLAELYSAAHVFINTTYEETYPTVNIEALCCGCPVITYHTGGSVESVDDTNGMVVPKGDIEAMVSAIEKAGNKNYCRGDISFCAKEKHTSARMIEQYMALYESIINSDVTLESYR